MCLKEMSPAQYHGAVSDFAGLAFKLLAEHKSRSCTPNRGKYTVWVARDDRFQSKSDGGITAFFGILRTQKRVAIVARDAGNRHQETTVSVTSIAE